MQALFICNWELDNILTQATVLPRLQVLQERNDIESVIFVTLERKAISTPMVNFLLPLTKVKYTPFKLGKRRGSVFKRTTYFVSLPIWLVNVAQKNNIDIILAHGSPAGSLAYKLWKRTKLPFYVSSFEPHANYMAESGVWKKYGLKYLFQSYWEKKQLALASGFMPVSKNYSEQLLDDGVPKEKVFTVPCTVNASDFKFNRKARDLLRDKHSWHHATVGIYTGKFGDLYYDDEAFFMYQKCFNLIPDFRLIILTPQSAATVEKQLLQYKIDRSKVYLNSVLHEHVSDYLSAADFAFATIKFYPSAKYCSPVKIGEYWANGLPVLLTEGVGDDSDIIRQAGGGALFNLEKEGSLERATQQIQQILKDPAHRQEIPKLAHKYRSPDRIKEAYDYFFGKGNSDL